MLDLLLRIIRKYFGAHLSAVMQSGKGGGCLFVPFSPDYVGGPATFMNLLKTYLNERNIAFTNSCYRKISHVFFPIEYEMKYLKLWKRKGIKIIQRLDGVYYKSQYGKNASIFNENIKEIYKSYADHIIFQSEYSKKQCYEVMGDYGAKRVDVILNGTDKTVFHPSSENITRLPGIEFCFITTGNFRELHMVEPLVKALDVLWEKNKKFKLKVLGVVDEKFDKHFNRPYIQLLGQCCPSEIADNLRSSDIFFYSFLNPNCPNSVIEAISCGLPVVSFSSGAIPELCYYQRDLLANVGDQVIHDYVNFSFTKLLEKLELCMTDFSKWKSIAVEHAGLYNVNDMAEAYVGAIYRN